LKISINGTDISSSKIAEEGFQTIRMNIPVEILHEGFNDISINVSSWMPSEHFDTKDIRELGVMIDSIGFVRDIEGQTGNK
jgi:hypothetical protein